MCFYWFVCVVKGSLEDLIGLFITAFVFVRRSFEVLTVFLVICVVEGVIRGFELLFIVL